MRELMPTLIFAQLMPRLICSQFSEEHQMQVEIWSPALSSGSGVFDPSLDTAGVYTYTVAPIAPCTTNASATATVTIQTPPDAGTDGSVDLCEDAGTVDLFTVLGGTPDAGGTWSPALNSGSGVFDPTVDVAGTYTYTLTNTVCTTPSSSQVVVTVQELPDAGTDANLDLCSTDAAVDLFTILGGTPDAGGIWSPALSSGSGVFDPSLDTAGVYTYTVDAIAPCTTNASATATVTIQTPPDAGTDGSVDLCEDAGAVDLFTVLGGTPDAGGTWSPALNSGSGVFDPTVDVAGTYTYTLTNTVCTTPSSSQVVVTVQELPDAGTDANLDLCSTDAAVDLFTILGGTPDAGGIWSPALSSGTEYLIHHSIPRESIPIRLRQLRPVQPMQVPRQP